MCYSPSLLDLPNCIILQLLQYLDATSLYLLGRTCVRLDEIIRNSKILWRRIDARRAPNDRQKVSYCTERCNKDTHMFLLQADCQYETLVFDDFYVALRNSDNMKNIVILALENQSIAGERYTVASFPKQLEEFSLRRTVVTNPLYFFKGSGEHFEKLRVLILDECDWVTNLSFMPIAKYAALEVLSFYNCKKLLNSIPYFGLARCGFKKLRVLDVRLSPLGNILIRSFYKLPSLLGLYFQNDDLGFKLDCFKRKLAILNGAPACEFYDYKEEFDWNDLMKEDSGLSNEELDDGGLLDYLATHSMKISEGLPKSVLYVDPYNECTCGHEGWRTTREDPSQKPYDSSDDDDDSANQNDDGNLTVKKIANRIAKLTHSVRHNNGYTRFHDQFATSCERAQGRGDHEAMNHEGESSSSNSRNCNSELLNADHTNHHNEIRKRSLNTTDGPEQKKQRPNGPTESSSGVNPIPGEPGNELDVNLGRFNPILINVNPVQLQMVEFRMSPWVQIENFEHVRKKIPVPLRRLSLRGYKKITNTALRYINNLDLELLDLTYTSVTADAIENYLVEHPSCRVIHEQFCTCPTNLHF